MKARDKLSKLIQARQILIESKQKICSARLSDAKVIYNKVQDANSILYDFLNDHVYKQSCLYEDITISIESLNSQIKTFIDEQNRKNRKNSNWEPLEDPGPKPFYLGAGTE